jgi:GDPmannose 4,6-dehydratase
VIATGRTVSLRYFVEAVFRRFGVDAARHVRSDTALLRPSDIRHGAADPRRAQALLGWRHTIDVDGVIDRLCQHASAKL